MQIYTKVPGKYWESAGKEHWKYQETTMKWNFLKCYQESAEKVIRKYHKVPEKNWAFTGKVPEKF